LIFQKDAKNYEMDANASKTYFWILIFFYEDTYKIKIVKN
jgi:hypothetical protein